MTASLSTELRKRGHDVRVLIPRYASIDAAAHPAHPVDSLAALPVPLGPRMVQAHVTASRPAGSSEVYYIGHEAYFGRKGIYDDPDTKEGYPDNAERFIFFQRAALETLKRTGFRPDIIHCHDQHTALVPGYLKVPPRSDPFFAGTGTVLTIHNLGYQGIFPPDVMRLTGFPPDLFAPLSAFEFFGKVNLMKAGIVYADIVTTVSPTYAREICGEEMGCGLEGVLRARGPDLVGILNGIDPDVWNPATDPHLPAHYDASDLEGKAVCRRELLRRMSLSAARGSMVVGMVTRLAEQKGLDLIEAAVERLMQLDVQIVVLGTGQASFHRMLTEAGARWPAKVTVKFGFSEEIAHLIEAGADAFLMPSRYEPCGLNQMYSLRYGTVPIVRATGGLADTVTDDDAHPDTGNGFSFTEYTPEALVDAVARAAAAYRNPTRWLRILRSGMDRDSSWAVSASSYESVYERAAAAARAMV